MAQDLTGGCQCGAVRYAAAGPILDVFVCHCTECRKQSASAFGISVIVSRDGFRVTQGSPKLWSRPTDSGRILDCHFCSECGTRLFHGTRDRHDTLSLKGGSLDQPPDLLDAVHIWVDRKLPGVRIPDGAKLFPGEPEDGVPPPPRPPRTPVQRVIYARRGTEVAVARIHAPYCEMQGEWRAAVACPAVLSHVTPIAGVDAAQARDLAARFVIDVMTNNGFTIADPPRG